jgi:hypothetical protein
MLWLHTEHPRWINRNLEDIFTTLKRCVTGNAYKIMLPEKTRAQEFDFIGAYNSLFCSRVRQRCAHMCCCVLML